MRSESGNAWAKFSNGVVNLLPLKSPQKVLVCSCNSENQIFWLLEESFRARFFQTGGQKLLFVNVIRLHKLYSIYQIIIQYTVSISAMQSNIKLMTVFCVYFGTIWFEIS